MAVSTAKEHTRSTDKSAKYHVEVHALDEGMPEGLSRVLDILQSAIAPVSVAPVAPVAIAQEPVVHTSLLPVLTPVEPASIESVPATSEATLQSEASSVGSVNSGGSAMSGWGAQGAQAVGGTGLVSLAALQQLTSQGATAETPDLSAVSVEILSATSADNSWSSLPVVEVDAISTLSERPPGDEGPAVWGNLPLAVALATQAFCFPNTDAALASYRYAVTPDRLTAPRPEVPA